VLAFFFVPHADSLNVAENRFDVFPAIFDVAESIFDVAGDIFGLFAIKWAKISPVECLCRRKSRVRIFRIFGNG